MSNSPIIVVIDILNPFVYDLKLFMIVALTVFKIVIIAIKAYIKMKAKPS